MIVHQVPDYSFGYFHVYKYCFTSLTISYMQHICSWWLLQYIYFVCCIGALRRLKHYFSYITAILKYIRHCVLSNRVKSLLQMEVCWLWRVITICRIHWLTRAINSESVDVDGIDSSTYEMFCIVRNCICYIFIIILFQVTEKHLQNTK